jgi:hypothetical protein
MRLAISILLVLHGLIHGAGFAKAFGLAALPALPHAPSRSLGLWWLAAGAAFVVAGLLLEAGNRRWWLVAAPALVVSQALIAGAFHTARFGTIVNIVLFVPVVLAALDSRSSSLRSRYAAEVRDGLAQAAAGWRASSPPVVTDDDLVGLPPLVRTYLMRAGVVGKPRVVDLHAVFHAKFRTARDARWMKATVDQYEFFGPSPRRLFLMNASRAGVPFTAFHRYVGDTATMQVRAAGILDVIDARGPEMTASETVTLFNDMCVFAPAALLDAPVTWRTLGEHQVEATYTNAGHTITAVLTFDEAGDLSGFVSNDRLQSDGRTTRRLPWSTPVSGYRDFGGARLAAVGQTRWREPDGGEWAYGEFTLERIDYDVGPGGRGLGAAGR